MVAANISVNSVDGSNADVPINVLVQLNNQNTGGEVSFLWVLLSQPEGSADSLSSTSVQNPTFTPRKEGTYLIQLIVNQGLSTEARDQVIVGVLQLKTRQRIPAAAESIESSTSSGWAFSVDRQLQLLDTMRADPGIQVCQVASGSVAANSVVRFVGTAVLKSGLPGQETILTVDVANATSTTNVDEPLGLVLATVDGSAVGNGKLVYVRRFGIQLITLGGATNGDPIYCSNAAAVALAPGTANRQIGRVVAVSGSNVHVYFDGSTFNYAAATTLSGNNPVTIVPDAAASPGVGGQAARDDHTHAIAAAVAGSITIGAAAAEGASTSFARADHTHGLVATSTIAAVDAAAASVGVSTEVAKADHKHQATVGTPVSVDKSANAEGSATSLARSDHKHDVSTAAAIELTDSTNAEGSATSLARSDHTHSHGVRAGGTLHAVSIAGGAAGFQSGADKAKQDATGVARSTVQTTDATVTTLASFTPADESVALLRAMVTALQSDGSNGAGYELVGAFRRDGGTTVQIGTTTIVSANEDVAGWDAAFDVSTPAARVRVTGAAATTVNWACVLISAIGP